MKLVLAAVATLIIYVFFLRRRTGTTTSFLSGSFGSMDCYTLLQRGVPARGILLQVGSQRSAQGSASRGFYEVRTVSIDVEVAGKPPYACSCSLAIPANLRPIVLPGATLELRVDPRSSNNIAVFGPGAALAAADFP